MENDNTPAKEPAGSIIPKPVSAQYSGETIDLISLERICLANGSQGERSVSKLIQDFLKPIKEFPVKQDLLVNGNILINLDLSLQIPDEGYTLIVGKNNSVELKAKTPAGLFYSFQTFRQLCPPELEKTEAPKNTKIPKVTIKDYPRFGYRGMHLDVSRHFFDVDFVKTYIDMIALHKMNVFHWHLTDDNGWRIEIDRYPELTEISAWRVDREHENWKEWSPVQPKEKPTYGGYYTKDDIREVVQYAAEKHIMVIPEIEMPGHTSEVFAAYPELSCKGDTLDVVPGSYWPNEDIFCAGNDKVFSFLENVISEVIELFPGPYVHIGGDEAVKTNWENCPKCQKRIKSENLKDEHGLQSWFIKKIEKFLISKNKKLVGWDEILEGGLAPEATVMSWRGTKGGVEAARQGHDVIMCPTSHCYFDYYQADPETSPEAIGGLTTLKKVYSFNPIPEELNGQEAKRILGAQGNLWTEYIKTNELAQYRVLPRMTALAEAIWSPERVRDYEDFYMRVLNLYKRFNILDWTYAPGSFVVLIQADTKGGNDDFSVNLSSEKPGTPIRFTLDGTDPTIISKQFTNPFSISKTTQVRAALFLNGIQAGKVSEKRFYFHKAMGKTVEYLTMHKQKYSGQGRLSLVDGLIGTSHYNDGYWQGWEGNDMDVVIDIGTESLVSAISVGFLESISSWIFLPSKVQVSFSPDGKNFTNKKTCYFSEGNIESPSKRKPADFTGLDEKCKFIRVYAESIGVCPDWHPGAGGKTWIFSDEIIIE